LFDVFDRAALCEKGAVGAITSYHTTYFHWAAQGTRAVNIILITADSFRRDHLGCYGNSHIHTPHLDAFAQRAVVFDNYITASFPTVLNRREVLTGRYAFTYADWGPLPPDELVLPEVLGSAGYTSMLVADTPHLFLQGFNFDRGFSAWHWIRGQGNDRLRTDPIEVSLPAAAHKLRDPERTVRQYLRNVSTRRSENDWFVAQTMTVAAHWLEQRAPTRKSSPFFLCVDVFDPHEPWDPPCPYVDLYDSGYQGEAVIYPAYGYWQEFLTQAELRHAHALYCGEVSLVDTWVGYLFSTIERLGLLEDTAIFFTSDHGFYFGEHGLIGKWILDPLLGSRPYPLHEEMARIPFIVYVPGAQPGRRIQAFAQPVDVMPTILEICKVRETGTTHGCSLVQAIQGHPDGVARDMVVSSYSIVPPLAGRPSTIMTDEWALVYGAPHGGDATAHVEPNQGTGRAEVPLPLATSPALYDRRTDPGHGRNVISDQMEVAGRLHARYLDFLKSVGTPRPYVERRRTLRVTKQ
jgi:arylsulfatase A-like enzyme